MKTNVIVNVKLVVETEYHVGNLTESLIEKLARDKVVDIINCPENKISIKEINAIKVK